MVGYATLHNRPCHILSTPFNNQQGTIALAMPLLLIDIQDAADFKIQFLMKLFIYKRISKRTLRLTSEVFFFE
jgi:hypothetical protein